MEEIIESCVDFLKQLDNDKSVRPENEYQRLMNYKDNLEDLGRKGVIPKKVASKCAHYYENKAKNLKIVSVSPF